MQTFDASKEQQTPKLPIDPSIQFLFDLQLAQQVFDRRCLTNFD